MATSRKPQTPMRFESMLQADVPSGRNGKHHIIVDQLLNDIDQLEEGNALKVPLSELPDTKENIRSALSRATRNKKIEIATSSDEEFLYIWKPGSGPANGQDS
jgi:TusA-related sulfurtransferase